MMPDTIEPASKKGAASMKRPRKMVTKVWKRSAAKKRACGVLMLLTRTTAKARTRNAAIPQRGRRVPLAAG